MDSVKDQDLVPSDGEASSVEYVEVLNSSSAYYSRRDLNIVGRSQSCSAIVETTASQLLLSSKVSNLEQLRDSVIVRTPNRQVFTSTPNISPPSIGNNFPDPMINYPDPLTIVPPPAPVHISIAMEAAEVELNDKIRNLKFDIDFIDVNDLTDEDLESYKDGLDGIANSLRIILNSIAEFVRIYGDQLSQEKKDVYSTHRVDLTKLTKEHSANVRKKISEIKKAMVPAISLLEVAGHSLGELACVIV